MNKKSIIAICIVLLLGIGLTIYFVSSSDDLTECGDSTQSLRKYCDADGKVIKIEDYDSTTGDLIGYGLAEYDAKGNLIKSEEYDAEDNLKNYTKHEYDAKGNEIKTEYYDDEGNLEGYNQFEYDDEGNEIKFEVYDADGNLID